MKPSKAPAVVAELGRPETPEETAARKAENSRKHRANQTLLNLVLATAASLGIVAFLFAVVVRPDAAPPEPVDYATIAESADAEVPLLAPVVPVDWYANAARLGNEFGVKTWYIGFITADEGFIALNQGIDANVSWVASEVDGRTVTGEATIGGLDWQVYDHRDAQTSGNYDYALVTELDGSTVVLHGTASDAEFESLAASIATAFIGTQGAP
jgi:hypothetical protein